jgi:hypothetical protein
LRTAQNAEESSLPLKTGHHPESINPLWKAHKQKK